MRRLILCLGPVLWLTACAGTAAPPPSSTSSVPAAARTVNPAGIKRIRPLLPQDYEIADVVGPVSAAGQWGFGPGWTADPPPCASLADPAPADPAARGYSASGRGGTLYVVVAAARGYSASGRGGTLYVVVAAAGAPGAGLLDECAQWAMAFAHTTGTVTLADPPAVDGADTVAMTVATRTVVESGSETNGQAATAQAYLDGHVVIVTLVTDPGSEHPPLDVRFVDDLLASSVAALRG
ncbi:DUF5642 family protein [Mycobacterium sp. M26]|uniref:DUF5642 family protein n=1 Tax=Mycobacterium sp. M26 TaxID=1762962 RepID=UPI0018D20D7B|nr:DUF5642 family protein [Mycobacterium sp. M26]